MVHRLYPLPTSLPLISRLHSQLASLTSLHDYLRLDNDPPLSLLLLPWPSHFSLPLQLRNCIVILGSSFSYPKSSPSENPVSLSFK